MSSNLYNDLPALIEELSSLHTNDSLDDRWESIIQRFFTYSRYQIQDSRIDGCRLRDDNHQLIIPAIRQERHYILQSPDIEHPYNDAALKLAKALLKMANQFISIQDAIEQGAAVERRRIARDLHDDVAARMLTLIHEVKEARVIELARSILKSLRNAIYTLDNKSSTLILDALMDIRAELQERLNTIGMQLFWNLEAPLEGLSFTPRQHINLQRILHEITTNVIRHAEAQFISVNFSCADHKLRVLVCDNGKGFDVDQCIPGKGINNIQTRIEEINGKVSWDNNDGCCIDIRIPI